MSVVTFDYAAWALRYPELSGSVAQPLAQLFFNEATMYCDNTECSPVSDVVQRGVFLNMLTAHIAKLNAPIGGQATSGIVGRISSASEGSVSVSTSMTVKAGSAEWYAQTTYGFAYWQASAQFRMAQYYDGPAFDADPYGSMF